MIPKAATIDSNVIDSLIEIERSGQAGFLSQVIKLFTDSTPEQIEAIGAALRQSDAQTLKANAHSLKSSSAGIGAMRMSELCQEIESGSQVPVLDQAVLNDLWLQLQSEFRAVIAELKKYQK